MRWWVALHYGMGRPRCDPIDVAGVLDALALGNVTLLAAYRNYASTAARPYARSSWQGIIDRARREAGPIEKVYRPIPIST
jgi:hypothetical protein